MSLNDIANALQGTPEDQARVSLLAAVNQAKVNHAGALGQLHSAFWTANPQLAAAALGKEAKSYFDLIAATAANAGIEAPKHPKPLTFNADGTVSVGE